MNRIKAIREAKELSLEKVALACDPPTTPKQIQRLENGERRLTTGWIKRLAKALDVVPSEIVPELAYPGEDWNAKINALNKELQAEHEKHFQYLMSKQGKG